MTANVLDVRRLARGALAGALICALSACADEGGDEEQDVTEELGIRVEAASGSALLARTTFSPSHRVEFWQEGSGAVVIEEYAPDLGEQSELGDLTDGASFADLYQKVAGKRASKSVLNRLRTADSRPRQQSAVLPERAASEPTTEPPSDAVQKSASEDAQWFSEQICNVRNGNIHPDLSRCHTESLSPGWKQVDWKQTGWYLFQGSLFNAASSGTAEFVVSPTDPAKIKKVTAGPRQVVRVATTSDNGFWTRGKGESFAIYYSFID